MFALLLAPLEALLMPADARERRRREAALKARRSAPQWSLLEYHFKAPAPDDLRALYASAMIHEKDLVVFNPLPGEPQRVDELASFLPADHRTLDASAGIVDDPSAFAFATDHDGHLYAVRFAGDPRTPSAVRLYRRDGGETEDVAGDLTAFLARAWSVGRRAR